jgi:outer membrane protein OmpA-like peptidoglycan-associated protein/rRNA processing protein Gar1
MKKISLIIVFVFGMILMHAQNIDGQDVNAQPEAAHTSRSTFHLFVEGGIGAAGLSYKLKNSYLQGKSNLNAGGDALLGFSFFFNENIGIGSGVGIAHFRSSGGYNGEFNGDKFISLGNQISDDANNPRNREYELRVRLRNWEEVQSALYLEIPVFVQYKHKFGAKQIVGLYFNVGVKFQIPLMSKYEVIDGSSEEDKVLNISGYNIVTGAEWGAPGYDPVRSHGFGSIYNPNKQFGWNNDLTLKPSVSGMAELGLLFALGRRVDLNLGVFLNYGFRNVKNDLSDKELLEAPEQYQPGANENIGYGITYNGVINSNATTRASLLSYGGKMGIHIRLGKMKTTPVEEQQRLLAQQEENDSLYNSNAADAILKTIKKLRDNADGEQPKPETSLDPKVEEQLKPAATEVATTTFRGVVVDATDNSPLQATVEVYDAAGNLVGVVASDSSTGIFEVEGLTLNTTYVIKVRRAGSDYSVVEEIVVRENEESSTQIVNIQLDKSERTVEPSPEPKTDKQLKPATVEVATTTFRGVVVDATDDSPFQATVEVYDAAGNLVGVVASDSTTGVFEIEGLALNTTYVIKVRRAGSDYSVVEEIVVRENEESSPQIVNIQLDKSEGTVEPSPETKAAEQVKPATLEVETTTFKGVVVDAADNNPFQATVEVYDVSGNLVGVVISDSTTGVFEIEGLALNTTYVIKVRRAGSDYSVVEEIVVRENEKSSPQIVNVQSNKSEEKVSAKVKTFMFKGVVTDAANGSPLQAAVEVYDASENVVGVAVSDASTGIFEIEGLALDMTYAINARRAGYNYFVQEGIVVPENEKSSSRIVNIQLDKLKEEASFTLKNIFFETAQATLKRESMKEIDNLYQLMVENPTLRIEVSGHTDNVGTLEKNKKLSVDRAGAVVQTLIRKGIARDRIESAGYGYDRPVDTNSTPEGRAQNRRVEFKVLKVGENP